MGFMYSCYKRKEANVTSVEDIILIVCLSILKCGKSIMIRIKILVF